VRARDALAGGVENIFCFMATFPGAGSDTSSRLLEGWTFLLLLDPELEMRFAMELDVGFWLG
jgi:hypothetical protein